MGYRINLSNANSIGHLIEGNVISFLDQTFLDDQYYEGNINYLHDLFSDENSDFISSDGVWFKSKKKQLREEWNSIQNILFQIKNSFGSLQLNKNGEYDLQLLQFFKSLSQFLGGYTYKYLLLPGFDNSELNNLMIDRRELKKLLQIEAGASYLILQLKEIPKKNDVQILQSFTHFNQAIERISEWPAVLLWENKRISRARSIFIPVAKIDEVRSIINAQNFEQDYFTYLRRLYGTRKIKKIAQLVHLSDLHLGIKGEESKKQRLLEILKRHRLTTDSKIQMYPIITGDLVDNPTEQNVNLYRSFESQLDSIGLQFPITVLGNHDYFIKGILRSNQKGKNVISSLASQDIVKVVDELKVIFICFNSNIDGNFAQGKIGSEQLANVGTLLDRIIGKDDYFKIAILHHHPFEMDRPTWMKKTWYENVLGKINFDVDRSNILVDSTLFIDWLNAREINFVLHGHKHIPKLFENAGFDIVAAGSSTGNIEHCEKDRTFITYNLINFDLELRKPISSTIVFEDIMGSGAKNYQVKIY